MSNAQQLIEQIVYFPEVTRPWAIPAAAIVGAGLIVKDWHKSQETTSEYAEQFSENDALLEKSIVDVTGERTAGQEATESFWKRLGARTMLVAGVSLAAGVLVSNPSVSVASEKASANVVFVLDSSDSMTLTKDMSGGQTRFNTALEGLKKISYNGNLSLVQYAGDAITSIPLQPFSTSEVNNISTTPDTLNSYGAGDAVAGLQQAVSVLPSIQTSGKNSAVRGDIILVSDGTISNSAEDITTEADQLKKQDVEVEVIVPGTATGTYIDNGSNPQDSGVNPTVFAGFGESNITSSSDAQTVESTIAAELDKAKPVKSIQKLPSYLLYALPVGLFAYGMRRYRNQVTKKTV